MVGAGGRATAWWEGRGRPQPFEATRVVRARYTGDRKLGPWVRGFDGGTYWEPLSGKGPKPLGVVASRKAGFSPPTPVHLNSAPHKRTASSERRKQTPSTGRGVTEDPCRPPLWSSSGLGTQGAGGRGTGLPLTERMASLMWASRWSFLSVAPVSGHVKHTLGTARWAEPSSLASGTWGVGCRRLSPWSRRRPLCLLALGHPGPAPEPPGRLPLCKTALRGQLATKRREQKVCGGFGRGANAQWRPLLLVP